MTYHTKHAEVKCAGLWVRKISDIGCCVIDGDGQIVAKFPATIAGERAALNERDRLACVMAYQGLATH